MGNIETYSFGASQEFAIRFNVRSDDAVSFSYLVNGIEIGGAVFSSGVNLRDSMERVVSGCGRREDCALFRCAAKDVFFALDADLMGRETKNIVPIPEDYWRFNLWFHHALGSYHIFAIACGERIKIIIGDITPTYICCVELGIKAVESSIREAYDWAKENLK